MGICVQAQQDLKVGLILSGGGAKGIAHVGVLKEIERAGVRIDYIGGTSMGAIVGGLYACGYTASQLEEMLTSTNLIDIINDKFDRDVMSFDAKEDASRYAITLPIVKGRIQFPLSLSKGQHVYDMFVQLMHEQRNTQDFSKLPTPFYCVATDINTGEKTVLDKGYLPLAVNASSALPTLFSPVHVEGRMLIDGGIVDNYPIDEMLSKGMDVIIGIDVQTNARTTDETSTLSEMLTRIGSFQTQKQMASKEEKTQIYIRPELDAFNILSFDKQKEILAQGVLAGQKARPQLLALAKNQQPRVKEQKDIPPSFQLDNLLVATTPNYKTNYLLGKLRLKSKNTYSFKKLKEGMSNLAATQNFDAFRYSLKTENGKEVLRMTPPETKHTTLFRGALHYDKLIGALALVNLTKKHAFLKNDEISLDVMLGAYFQYAFSYFIDKGKFWSVGLSAKQHQFNTTAPVSVNTDKLAINKPTNTRILVQKNTWFVQTLFREEVVLGAGLAHQHNVFKTNLFDTQTARFLYADNADYYSALGYLKVDTRDDKFYPRRGGFFEGDINYYFSEKSSREDIMFTPFLIAKANMGATFPLDSKWALLLSTSGGFTVGDTTSSAFDFTFGGYGNAPVLNYQTFIGLPQQHVAGNSFVKAETTIDYEFTPKHHLKMILNGGIVSTDIFKTGQWKRGIDYYSAGITYGLETFAGPIEFTTAYSPQFSRLLLHVNIGWQF
ncbi:patatin-like phospholipase family protein [Flavobacteriaceae bacterium]|nr:patatin-like phospholipase family protein [Flavobacteriaceae bacterium]